MVKKTFWKLILQNTFNLISICTYKPSIPIKMNEDWRINISVEELGFWCPKYFDFRGFSIESLNLRRWCPISCNLIPETVFCTFSSSCFLPFAGSIWKFRQILSLHLGSDWMNGQSNTIIKCKEVMKLPWENVVCYSTDIRISCLVKL